MLNRSGLSDFNASTSAANSRVFCLFFPIRATDANFGLFEQLCLRVYRSSVRRRGTGIRPACSISQSFDFEPSLLDGFAEPLSDLLPESGFEVADSEADLSAFAASL